MASKEDSMEAGSRSCKNGIVALIILVLKLDRQIFPGLARGGDKGSRTPKNWIDNSILANLLSPPKASYTKHYASQMNI